jgi:hypothetical protein
VDTVEMLDSSAYVWGSYFERLSFPDSREASSEASS